MVGEELAELFLEGGWDMMSWEEWREASVFLSRFVRSRAPGTEVVTKSMVAFALFGR